MITLLIVFIILSIIGFLLWLFGKGQETVFAGFALIGALCIVIPSIIQSTSLSYGLIPTRNFIDGQLFYDETNEKYYAIYSDENWKFWDLYEKVEIPKDIALQKIASTNKMEKISK